MSRYLIVIEPSATGYSAYSPDLEGCVSIGATRGAVERSMQEAIEFHLDGLRDVATWRFLKAMGTRLRPFSS
jgi:predicted RNase H-like HicB family nuclease